MTAVEVFAPAKINLALHVTGRRDDGYHEIDSLVAFADVGDRLRLTPDGAGRLAVAGPFAGGVPAGDDNLVRRALAAVGASHSVELRKTLPPASGIGGGSADAAAALRGAVALGCDEAAARRAAPALGADVPMCLDPRPQRARGLGERLAVVDLPDLPAVLVNPGVAVATPAVFAGLAPAARDPLPAGLPRWRDAAALCDWLRAQRNDLEPPARDLAPAVAQATGALLARSACRLARMSGSGATAFGIFEDGDAAAAAAAAIAAARPGWWVRACRLGDMSARARPTET